MPTLFKMLTRTVVVLDVPVVEVEYQGPNSLVTSSYSGSDQNVSLREGETVIIRCRADANPPANVMWRRAGVRGVWSTEPEVVLDNVGKEEAGVYTCTAHNSLGVSGPKEIILNVECKLLQITTYAIALNLQCFRLAHHRVPVSEWPGDQQGGQQSQSDVSRRRQPRPRLSMGPETQRSDCHQRQLSGAHHRQHHLRGRRRIHLSRA